MTKYYEISRKTGASKRREAIVMLIPVLICLNAICGGETKQKVSTF